MYIYRMHKARFLSNTCWLTELNNYACARESPNFEPTLKSDTSAEYIAVHTLQHNGRIPPKNERAVL